MFPRGAVGSGSVEGQTGWGPEEPGQGRSPCHRQGCSD